MRSLKISKLVMALLMPVCIRAQLNVGEADLMSIELGENKLNDAIISEFKNTTTVFILPDFEKDKLEEYKKAIAPVWTFNKIEFINQKDYSTYYQKSGYSFFSVSWYQSYYPAKPNPTPLPNFYLEYKLPYKTKKNENAEKTLAIIKLRSQYEYDSTFKDAYIKYNEAKFKEEMNKLIPNSKFYNFTLTHIKCYLSFINQCLVKKEKWDFQKESVSPEILKGLSTDTLFIPSYINARSKNIANKQGKGSAAEFLSAYTFNYKILNEMELINRVRNTKKPTFLLTYICVDMQKFITIFELNSAKIAYSTNERTWNAFKSTDIDSKDFESLSRAIKKASK